MLLAKPKLTTIEVLTPTALIDSHINRDEFFLVNNVLREYNEMEEEIKNTKNIVQYKSNGVVLCQL